MENKGKSSRAQTFSVKHFLLSWLTLFRLGATARGVLPFLLGGVIAWSQGYAINWAVFVISALAVTLIMLMTFELPAKLP